jgi:ElaB/YqjD/DUF883 family membrane-anchored ribosome-binding protein
MDQQQMDQEKNAGALSGSAAKVGQAAGDLAAETKELAQGKKEEVTSALGNLQASAGDAMNKVTELARKASDVGIRAASQASDAIQGTAREVGSQAYEQAYQQATRAQGQVAQFVTEQPLAALLIAGAIGYGLAFLTLRRSS